MSIKIKVDINRKRYFVQLFILILKLQKHYTDGQRVRIWGDVTKILKATEVRMRQNLVLECGYQGSF